MRPLSLSGWYYWSGCVRRLTPNATLCTVGKIFCKGCWGWTRPLTLILKSVFLWKTRNKTSFRDNIEVKRQGRKQMFSSKTNGYLSFKALLTWRQQKEQGLAVWRRWQHGCHNIHLVFSSLWPGGDHKRTLSQTQTHTYLHRKQSATHTPTHTDMHTVSSEIPH